ncbi:hypothetical protein EDEG_02932 [Edhazardia aedis USNM 41457]|uniref:Uncharacterized protein n=1 Tax=Edhazardia aedis (strain USNM 41457) TaxID=1003232 RepID=J9DJ93_EDHAE|nr:hypothetical protein EDEG_02932 [Edhazardia aedis USNM 41457]|eukprot:EJW02670.1 hypothetical protein EDEG_02932 [Edhazardia aedis USNM 41457]
MKEHISKDNSCHIASKNSKISDSNEKDTKNRTDIATASDQNLSDLANRIHNTLLNPKKNTKKIIKLHIYIEFYDILRDFDFLDNNYRFGIKNILHKDKLTVYQSTFVPLLVEKIVTEAKKAITTNIQNSLLKLYPSEKLTIKNCKASNIVIICVELCV